MEKYVSVTLQHAGGHDGRGTAGGVADGGGHGGDAAGVVVQPLEEQHHLRS